MANFRNLITGNGIVLGLSDDNQMYILGDKTNKNTVSRIANDGPLYATGWKTASVNAKHSAAITNSNQLYVWGDNSYGQLGVGGSVLSSMDPILIDNSEWIGVSCGARHTIALKKDGSLWGWGSNQFGQLGPNAASLQYIPSRISEPDFSSVVLLAHLNGFADSTNIADSSLISKNLKILGSGKLSSTRTKFGNTSYYYGDSGNSAIYVDGSYDDLKFGTGDFTIEGWFYLNSNSSDNFLYDTRHPWYSSGGSYAYVMSTGVLNIEGQATIIMPTGRWVHVAFSRQSGVLRTFFDGSLVYTQNSTISYDSGYCYIGAAAYYPAGASPFRGYIDEVRVTRGVSRYVSNFNAPDSAFVDSSDSYLKVAAGSFFNLAIKSDGTLWSWGDNSLGQLGTASTASYVSKLSQIGTDTSWRDIVCGDSHAMAVKANGSLYSWGYNNYGQCGLDTTTVTYNAPVAVTGVSDGSTNYPILDIALDNEKRIACGKNHSFIIARTSLGDNILYAAGDNSNAQLGMGNNNNKKIFTVVDISKRFISTDAGSTHSLGKLDLPENQPTPSTTPTLTPTPTVTASATPTVTPTATTTPTLTPTVSSTPPLIPPSPSPTATISPTPSLPARAGFSWFPINIVARAWNSIVYSTKLDRFVAMPRNGTLPAISENGSATSWIDTNSIPNLMSEPEIIDAKHYLVSYTPSNAAKTNGNSNIAISYDGFNWSNNGTIIADASPYAISSASAYTHNSSADGHIVAVGPVLNSNSRIALRYKKISVKDTTNIAGSMIPEQDFAPFLDSNNRPIVLSNTANYNNYIGTVTDVRYNGGTSPYGAYDMTGNVDEWTSTSGTGGTSFYIAGGNYTTTNPSKALTTSAVTPTTAVSTRGFRLASVTNPINNYGEFVTVSDINNDSDNGIGSVTESYRIGKYPITNSEYVTFLNAIQPTGVDSSHFHNIPSTLDSNCGIKAPYTFSRIETSLSYAQGIDLNPDTNRAYIARYNDGIVQVIDLATSGVSNINVGVGGLYDIISDATNNKVYVSASSNNVVKIINTTTNAVVGTVMTGSKPQNMALDTQNNRLYVSNFWSNSITVINTATMSVATTIYSIPGNPMGLAVDPTNNLLYLSYHNQTSAYIRVMNLSNYTTIQTVNLGGSTSPMYIKLNSTRTKLFIVESTNNSIAVMNTSDYSISRINIGTSSRGAMYFDNDNQLYVTGYANSSLIIINATTNTIVNKIALPINGVFPIGVAVNNNTKKTYITYWWSSAGSTQLTVMEKSNGYSVIAGMENKPLCYVNWYSAARYANWLSNGKPSGMQSLTTTEDGAYTLTGNTGNPILNLINPNTGSAPAYYIPSRNQWYKAAYYKSGGTNAGYWTYGNTSDSLSPIYQFGNSLENLPSIYSVVKVRKDGLAAVAGQGFVLLANMVPGTTPKWNYYALSDLIQPTEILFGDNNRIVILQNPIGTTGANNKYYYSDITNYASSYSSVSWTLATLPVTTSSTTIGAAAHDNGVFVIIPTNASLSSSCFVSYDGISWSTVSSAVLSNKTWRGLASKNNLFVAVGDNSPLAAISYSDVRVTPTPTATPTVTPSNLGILITQQPKNVDVVLVADNNAGGIATFSVTASSREPIAYQWYESINNGAFSAISGATLNTFSISGITSSKNGNRYYVKLTSGNIVVDSNIAILNVFTNSPISIVQQPTDTTATGASASFSVLATINYPSRTPPATPTATPTLTPTVTPSVSSSP